MKKITLIECLLVSFSLMSQTSTYLKNDTKNRLVLEYSSDCSYIKYNLDANGNRISAQTGQIVVNPKIDSMTCYQSNNAKIDLRPDSVNKYTYLWSGGKTTPTIENLASGGYAVTITDKTTGAECYKSFSIKDPDTIKLKLNLKDNVCYQGRTGKAVIDTAFLGVGFQYKWSDSSVGYQLTGLAKGNYGVKVSDANGCSKSIQFSITDGAKIIQTISKTEPKCNGGRDGKLNLTLTNNDFSKFSFLWSDGISSANRTNISKGDYSVILTETATGCKDTMSATLNEPTRVKSVAENIEPSCKGQSTGKFSVTTNGGSSPYYYALNTGSFNSSTAFTNLSPATYMLYSRDILGCSDTLSVVIESKDCSSGISNQSPNNLITLYPNPHQGIFHIEFSENLTGQVEIQIMTLDGKLAMNLGSINLKMNKTHSFTTESLVSGEYILMIRKNGRMVDSIKLRKD